MSGLTYRVDPAHPKIVVREDGDMVCVAISDPAQAGLIADALNMRAELQLRAVRALEGLPAWLAAERRESGLTVAQIAAETGIAKATLYRVESGREYMASTAVALLTWLIGRRRDDHR